MPKTSSRANGSGFLTTRCTQFTPYDYTTSSAEEGLADFAEPAVKINGALVNSICLLSVASANSTHNASRSTSDTLTTPKAQVRQHTAPTRIGNDATGLPTPVIYRSCFRLHHAARIPDWPFRRLSDERQEPTLALRSAGMRASRKASRAGLPNVDRL
jgi:hypothetical protein